MIQAVIAEDEEVVAAVLKLALEATGKVSVAGVAATGLQCLQLFYETLPEALFLDIGLPDISGLEVAEAALNSGFPPLIAFVTGHPEYAVKAFELAAVDFLIKPFTLERLQETIARMETMLRQKSFSVEAASQALDRLFQQETRKLQKLVVRDGADGSFRLIPIASIITATRLERHVVLRTLEGEFPTTYAIQLLEQRLAAEGFFRVNSGTLVNLEHFDRLVPRGDGSYDLILNDGNHTLVQVSRSRSKELLQTLKP